ncbi:MAG TPA: hypothetical protein VE982_02720 [Gaiellaceae bacterium]|nr:hypothetical protein [Gaiellaceae bacterium]
MTAQSFALALALGAALLAIWTVVRFPRLGPRSFARAFAQTLVASVVLRLMGPGMDLVQAAHLPLDRFVMLFGVALPALYYAFLSGAWVARAALDRIHGAHDV